MAASSKGRRCDNFTEAEKTYLAELVKENQGIEDKGYDPGTIEKKTKRGQKY